MKSTARRFSVRGENHSKQEADGLPNLIRPGPSESAPFKCSPSSIATDHRWSSIYGLHRREIPAHEVIYELFDPESLPLSGRGHG